MSRCSHLHFAASTCMATNWTRSGIRRVFLFFIKYCFGSERDLHILVCSLKNATRLFRFVPNRRPWTQKNVWKSFYFPSDGFSLWAHEGRAWSLLASKKSYFPRVVSYKHTRMFKEEESQPPSIYSCFFFRFIPSANRKVAYVKSGDSSISCSSRPSQLFSFVDKF